MSHTTNNVFVSDLDKAASLKQLPPHKRGHVTVLHSNTVMATAHTIIPASYNDGKYFVITTIILGGGTNVSYSIGAMKTPATDPLSDKEYYVGALMSVGNDSVIANYPGGLAIPGGLNLCGKSGGTLNGHVTIIGYKV